MFPNSDGIFQDGSSPIHTAKGVQSWFWEHEDALQHCPWTAQSPDIFEPLWSVLKSGVRSRFPPSSFSQLEGVLHEEWHSIPQGTIKNLHESIPRRM